MKYILLLLVLFTVSCIEGPIGPQGEQGEQGEQGIQGIQGPPGIDGKDSNILMQDTSGYFDELTWHKFDDSTSMILINQKYMDSKSSGVGFLLVSASSDPKDATRYQIEKLLNEFDINILQVNVQYTSFGSAVIIKVKNTFKTTFLLLFKQYQFITIMAK